MYIEQMWWHMRSSCKNAVVFQTADIQITFYKVIYDKRRTKLNVSLLSTAQTVESYGSYIRRKNAERKSKMISFLFFTHQLPLLVLFYSMSKNRKWKPGLKSIATTPAVRICVQMQLRTSSDRDMLFILDLLILAYLWWIFSSCFFIYSISFYLLRWWK